MQERIKKFAARMKLQAAIATFGTTKLGIDLRNRTKTFKEILDTEQTYFSSLKICYNHYYKRFKLSLKYSARLTNKARKEEVSSEGMIFKNVKEFDQLFDCFVDVLNLSKIFLKEMKTCWRNFPHKSDFANVFLKYMQIPGEADPDKDCRQAFPFYNIYVTYISEYVHKIKLYGKLKQRKAFLEFLQQVTANSGGTQLPLEDYLIMPVQRLPRYQMLLKSILKSMDQNHKEYIRLNEAAEKIATVLNTANENAKRIQEGVGIGNSAPKPIQSLKFRIQESIKKRKKMIFKND